MALHSLDTDPAFPQNVFAKVDFLLEGMTIVTEYDSNAEGLPHECGIGMILNSL